MKFASMGVSRKHKRRAHCGERGGVKVWETTERLQIVRGGDKKGLLGDFDVRHPFGEGHAVWKDTTVGKCSSDRDPGEPGIDG